MKNVYHAEEVTSYEGMSRFEVMNQNNNQELSIKVKGETKQAKRIANKIARMMNGEYRKARVFIK